MRTLIFVGCCLAWMLVGCGGTPKENTSTAPGKVVMSYDEALTSAKTDNKPVLLVAYTTALDRIESNLLNDPAVKQRSSKVITAKLDANTQGASISRMGITQYPAILILRPDGTEAWRSRGVPMPGEVGMEIDKVTASKN